jgi:superfamily II DNA or RNA helicase
MNPILAQYLLSRGITLRPLQEDALACTLVARNGQVFLPTGTGKTIVEVLTSLDCLLHEQEAGRTGVAVFASHRLLLCEQLLGELIKYANGIRLNFDVLTVASDGVSEDDVARLREGLGPDLLRFCTVEMTTTTDGVAAFIEESHRRNRHVLVVATYQSFERLQRIPKINIACMDEAHTIVESDRNSKTGNKFDHVETILSKGLIDRVFFFTATPVHGCNGRGMDNSTIYGPVLVSKTPRQALDYGDIVPPVIHKIIVSTTKGKPSLSAIIKRSYEEHRRKIQEIGGDQKIAQLLVSVEGIDEMVALVTRQTTTRDLAQGQQSFQDWARDRGITTIAFSSGKGYYLNGHDVTRKIAVDTMRELSGTGRPFILFHYDILTEGIDLPNLTGVLPLRQMDTVKFLQLFGRAARLIPADRVLLAQGIKSQIGADNKVELNPAMEKPCYWVLDPQINKDISQAIVDRIRTEYELEPSIKDYQEPNPPGKGGEGGPPYPPPILTKPEIEARTLLVHEYEVYRLMVLAGTEQGIRQITAVLEQELDNINSQGGQNATQTTPTGGDSVETSVPETDRVGAPESDTSGSTAPRGGLTAILGY